MSDQHQVIVGGGIIGLSIAYELVKRGHRVTVLERNELGQQASWAGAGIVTPSNVNTAIHPLEHLDALSHTVHRQWAEELKTLTGIDNQFRECGGLYLARTAGETAALTGVCEEWNQREIKFDSFSSEETYSKFGFLNRQPRIRRSVLVSQEAQFDNRSHVQALIASCLKLGVELKDQSGSVNLVSDETPGAPTVCMLESGKKLEADNVVVAAGPWSEEIIGDAGVVLPMQPVRGQVALFQIPHETTSTANWPIVNEGSRYLVPRIDGRVVVGATIEEVGFDCETTSEEMSDLRAWAESVCSLLNDSNFVDSWAGLRPGTYDGFPYLGAICEFENVFVATGHFKSGLQLSTGTAIVLADLVEGKTPSVDLRPFAPSRVGI